MRDVFEELYANEPLDPMEAARRGARPALRARFYRKAGVGERGVEGYPVQLDGRPVRSPAKAVLAAPTHELALAISAEWDAQRDRVDPARMPLTRLANSIIDGVVRNPGPVAAEIEKYLGSDLLLYRAVEPEGLVVSQARHWNPVLDWAREELGAHFVPVEGIGYVAQPKEAVAAAAGAFPKHAWRLGAANSVTSLTGSALLALALARGRLDAAAAWAAAHVDEDWNMETWGRDQQALARRDFRYAEMEAAALILTKLHEDG
jgi:chaperone required for assembly of F1-ATPase